MTFIVFVLGVLWQGMSHYVWFEALDSVMQNQVETHLVYKINLTLVVLKISQI